MKINFAPSTFALSDICLARRLVFLLFGPLNWTATFGRRFQSGQFGLSVELRLVGPKGEQVSFSWPTLRWSLGAELVEGGKSCGQEEAKLRASHQNAQHTRHRAHKAEHKFSCRTRAKAQRANGAKLRVSCTLLPKPKLKGRPPFGHASFAPSFAARFWPSRTRFQLDLGPISQTTRPKQSNGAQVGRNSLLFGASEMIDLASFCSAASGAAQSSIAPETRAGQLWLLLIWWAREQLVHEARQTRCKSD